MNNESTVHKLILRSSETANSIVRKNEVEDMLLQLKSALNITGENLIHLDDILKYVRGERITSGSCKPNDVTESTPIVCQIKDLQEKADSINAELSSIISSLRI